MGNCIAAGADDMLRPGWVLWCQSQDAEFPGLGMGNDVGSARVRRAWLPLVQGFHVQPNVPVILLNAVHFRSW